MYLKTVRISSIVQFHEVRDLKKYQKLKADMEKNGWNGRPLLVVEYEGKYIALTGSHRLSAAKSAGLKEIPVACLEYGTMFDDYKITIDELKVSKVKSPDDIYQILEEFDKEAAALFSEDEFVEKIQKL